MSQLTNLFDDIADAIRLKTGSSAQIVASNFPQEIANIPAGIDTSDATATAGDIGIGKTAYANGVKLTGTNHWNPNVIPPAAGTLTSLVVGQLPDKTIYYYGESPDLYGLTILGNYSNGFQYDVTGNCTYTVNDPLTYQDTAIVASLDGVSLSIPITVKAYPVPVPDETKGLWHYDDGTNKNEIDGLGTTSSGTGPPTTITTVQGVFGTDGARGGVTYWLSYNNSLNLTKHNNSDMGTANFTFECWFQVVNSYGPTSTSFAFCLRVEMSNGSNQSLGPYLEYNPSTRILRHGTNSSQQYYTPGGTVVSFSNVDWGSWHHFAYVLNQGMGTVYIDGQVAIQGTSPVSYSSCGLNYIRTSTPFSSSGSAGCIDEVLITESAKYTAPFEPPHAEYYLEDFIESTGTQYIDTGFTPNQNSGFEIDFVPLDNTPTSSNAPSVINSGGTGSYGDQNARMVISYYPTTSGATGECQLGNKKVDPRMSKGVRTQLSLKNKVLTYKDGTTASMNTTDFTGYNSLLIFAAHNATVQRFAKVRLFSLKLYDGDTLVRDFVPALVNGTPCLYDKVTDTNYYNSGTGTFTYRVAQQST